MYEYSLRELKQTCWACPSQWEIELKDGRYVYARFRWGDIGFGIGETLTKAVRNYNYGEQVSGEYDGVMNTKTMVKYLKKFLKEIKISYSKAE